jgi:hypothetical protein
VFLTSVMEGFAGFLHWQVWVVVLGFAAIMFGVSLIGRMLTDGNGSILGVVWTLALSPIVQIVATLTVVLIAAPLVFLKGESAGWQLPWLILIERPSSTAKLIAGTFLVIAIIGGVGKNRTPNFSQIAVCAIMVASTAALLAIIHPQLKSSDLQIWPGMLPFAGFIAIALLIHLVTFVLVHAAASKIARKFSLSGDKWDMSSAALTMSLSASVLFLPSFMYAAYLSPQLWK